MAHRVGQLEIQFNWIFILIAGAVIFAFFFSVVQKQRNLSDQKIALSLLNDLDAITTGASVATGAAQRLELPRTGVDFTCSEECACALGIGSFSRDYDDKLIFAPKHIEGEDVVLWTLDWQMPFRAANFLFATNDRVKYFFVHDPQVPASQQLRAKIQQDLPKQVNAEYVTVDDVDCQNNPDCVTNENYIQIKFVFLEINPSLGQLELHNSFKDTDVGAVHIAEFVTFYERQGRSATTFTSQRSWHAGDATLYGAIFAQDATMYACNVRQAARRLGFITHIMDTRMQTFINDAQFATCPYSHATLGSLWQVAASQASGLTEDFATLPTIAQTLDAENEQLIRLSCPTLY